MKHFVLLPPLRKASKRYSQWLTRVFAILQPKAYPDEFRLLA
jgi:hypothetical protein